MTKESLQVGGRRQWFEQERDGLCQVYLLKTWYAGMNTSPDFKPDKFKEVNMLTPCPTDIYVYIYKDLNVYK